MTGAQRMVVRSLPRACRTRHATPNTFVSVQVAGSETTSQLPISPKTAESVAPLRARRSAQACHPVRGDAAERGLRTGAAGPAGYLHEAYSASSALLSWNAWLSLRPVCPRGGEGEAEGEVRVTGTSKASNPEQTGCQAGHGWGQGLGWRRRSLLLRAAGPSRSLTPALA